MVVSNSRPGYSRKAECPGRITFYTQDKLVYPFDHKLSIWLHELLVNKGVEVCTSHTLIEASEEANTLQFNTENRSVQRESDWVIIEPSAQPSVLATQVLQTDFDSKHLVNKQGLRVVGSATRDLFKVLSSESVAAMADSVSRQIISGRNESAPYEHIAQVRLPISTSAVRDLGFNAEGRVVFSNEHSGIGLLAENAGEFASFKTKAFWNAVWN